MHHILHDVYEDRPRTGLSIVTLFRGSLTSKRAVGVSVLSGVDSKPINKVTKKAEHVVYVVCSLFLNTNEKRTANQK